MDACSHLKEQYDTCFNTWFTQKFLKGDYDDEMCAPLLKVYTQCVKKAMKEEKLDFKEFEEDILGTEKEYKPPPPK
ncbi:unnamed protein product [Bemisia tabaci]|uniref:TP53-regulated inhibitor of apoptosis 1 n=1 Tax=Bemisia tabaci TaxID=7038 RepID=A0A9P0A099_BEMTA|nr:PREDICTED: TP53-regulated inhibitor of apoptosis 1-like isoform X2 [Bemisia tabaci]CAH0381570.1 unnamed protein product [Bemisia tabaci]